MTLTTERLMLIPIETEDEAFVHACFTDPFVRKYLWDDQEIERALTQEILSQNDAQFKKERSGLWRITLHNTEGNIGLAGLWYFFEEPQPQLLYALMPDYTGQGYATEASQAILTYAFETLKFTYLDAACDPPHQASQQVAQRIGMTSLGEKIMDGKPTLFFRRKKSDELLS